MAALKADDSAVQVRPAREFSAMNGKGALADLRIVSGIYAPVKNEDEDSNQATIYGDLDEVRENNAYRMPSFANLEATVLVRKWPQPVMN